MTRGLIPEMQTPAEQGPDPVWGRTCLPWGTLPWETPALRDPCPGGRFSPAGSPSPLTCSVPDGDVVGAPLLQVEGTAHRADRVREAPLHVPLQQRRLAHVHVPQKYDLPVGLPHLPAGGTPPFFPRPPAGAPGVRLEQPDAPRLLRPGTRGDSDSRGPRTCTLSSGRLGMRKRKRVSALGWSLGPRPTATSGAQAAAVGTRSRAPRPRPQPRPPDARRPGPRLGPRPPRPARAARRAPRAAPGPRPRRWTWLLGGPATFPRGGRCFPPRSDRKTQAGRSAKSGTRSGRLADGERRPRRRVGGGRSAGTRARAC